MGGADLTTDFFKLFGLPVGFDLDTELLALRFRELQRVAHPDRFAGATDQERRLAVQQAARINEAFRTLKEPLSRARYLLELRGGVLDDTDTAMPAAFLMEQMELREAIEAVRGSDDPFGKLETLRDDLEGRERALVGELGQLFAADTPGTLERAREVIRKMQFMQRLLDEVARLEEDLVHEL